MNSLDHLTDALRTPLEQISGPLEQLQHAGGKLSEKERKRLCRIIEEHTSRMLDLVDRLRTVDPALWLPPTAISNRPPDAARYGGLNAPVDRTPTGRRRSSRDGELLEGIFRMMEENLERPEFGVHKMCEMAHMSHMHFIRKVKVLTGKRPLDLLKSYRLKRAKELLRQPHLTVAEIAYKVGYETPNSFTRAFKKEFGICPSECHG